MFELFHAMSVVIFRSLTTDFTIFSVKVVCGILVHFADGIFLDDGLVLV